MRARDERVSIYLSLLSNKRGFLRAGSGLADDVAFPPFPSLSPVLSPPTGAHSVHLNALLKMRLVERSSSRPFQNARAFHLL